jgi:hypothetical protein
VVRRGRIPEGLSRFGLRASASNQAVTSEAPQNPVSSPSARRGLLTSLSPLRLLPSSARYSTSQRPPWTRLITQQPVTLERLAPHSEGYEFPQIEKYGGSAGKQCSDRIGTTAGMVMSRSTRAPMLFAIVVGEFLRFAWQGSKFRRRDTAFGSRFVGRGYLQNDIFLSWLRSKNKGEGQTGRR